MVALLTVLGLASVLPAKAHAPVSSYFPPSHIAGLNSSWPFGSMHVHFTASVPGGQTFRDRVQEAHANWPQVATGRPPVTFSLLSTNYSMWGGRSLPDNYNGVHWVNLNTDIYAGLTLTSDYYGHWNTQVGFNSYPTVLWNILNSAPYSYEDDLESVATHEFGHMYGFRAEWSANGPNTCVSGVPYHTMCPTVPPGQAQVRTPELHDIHTMLSGFQA